MSMLLDPTVFPPYNPGVPSAIDVAADFVMLGAGAFVLFSTVLWTMFARPFKTAGGRAVWGFLVSLTLLMGLIIFGRFQGGEYIGRDLARLLVYGIVFCASGFLAGTIVYRLVKGENTLESLIRLRRSGELEREGSTS